MSNFRQLQKEIDKAINKFGSEKLVDMLSVLCEETETQTILLVFKAASSHFNIEIDELVEPGSKKHFEKREICYHLIKKNLPDYSISKIAKACKRGKQPIHRGITEMEFYLGKPNLNQKLVSDYAAVEKRFGELKYTFITLKR